MRKYLSVFALLTLVFTLLCGFDFAGAAAGGTYVYDDADVLTAEEEAAIQAQIVSLRDKAKSDILVVFTNEAEDTSSSIVTTWASTLGLGYDDNHETVVYYVNLNIRTSSVKEYNEADKFRISDSEVEDILDAGINAGLSDGNYLAAAQAAVEEIKGAVKPGFFSTVWSWLLIALAGSGAVTGIGVSSHNASERITKRYYLKDRKANVLKADDIFVNKTVETRTISDSDSDRSSSDSDHVSGGSKTF